ncbi:ead/Ea22-like family protein [Citrobacter koseri]|uniref:ead/Ea22-like family protein n=1 Tax=Citrobacter koseri TaxID=545 RepID=UPI003CFF5041
MNNIDKRALREAADSVIQKYGSEWFETGRQLCTVHKSKIELIAAANPAAILALLDELEAAEKRIAELEAKLQTADKLQDSAFRHGLQYGFSYGQTNDQAGFEQCLAAYSSRGKDNG